MKYAAALPILALVLALGLDHDVPVSAAAVGMPREVPVVNVAKQLREWNWGGGSCVHASEVMHLRFSNNQELAAFWRKTYSGGESYNGLTSKLTRNQVPWYSSYASNRQAVSEFERIIHSMGGTTYGTVSGDVSVLDRCIRERRGAVIFYYDNHSILLVHMDAEQAIVLDNNRINEFIRIPRAEFIKRWQGYGGVAVVSVIGAPRPPLPWVGS